MFEFFSGSIGDFDDFKAACFSPEEFQTGFRNAQEFGQVGDDFLIGFTFDRRSGDAELKDTPGKGIVFPAEAFVFPGVGGDFEGQFHEAETDWRWTRRKKTARGYSTDAETLESLRPYSPVIDEILKYRTYSKLLSTYVDGLLNAEAADGRVHSTFIQTEARTGRISSTEPNLQNIPIRTELGSRLRGYFVAGEGETLVDADYSQIELRILAHITGDEHMQQAFLNGADIHRSTAAKIYHIPESEVTPQLRSASKAINFGIMYGKGAYSLSKDLGISVKEADSFLKTYLDTFPKVDGYMKDCIAHAKDKGYVETLFGRRRALPELASSNFQVRASGERMARNTPIQGTAADIIKLAMVHVWQRLREEKLQARLLLQVHDELIVEAPEAECDEVKRILKEEMENVVHYSVPLTTEVGTGKTWLAAH